MESGHGDPWRISGGGVEDEREVDTEITCCPPCQKWGFTRVWMELWATFPPLWTVWTDGILPNVLTFFVTLPFLLALVPLFDSRNFFYAADIS